MGRVGRGMVALASEQLLDRLGHLELRQKQCGDIVHAEGIRLAIVEVMKLVNEANPKPIDLSPLTVRLM